MTLPASQAQTYFIYTDQLNTPRVITDQTNKVVWRWDNQDPFGGNIPDEDPDGDGIRFTCNLRFPGQYADRETGINYNYYRDYSPDIGRYIQGDPIGLQGNINTYLYANGDPLVIYDPFGLADRLPVVVFNASFGAQLGGNLEVGPFQLAAEVNLGAAQISSFNTEPTVTQKIKLQLEAFGFAVGPQFYRSAPGTEFTNLTKKNIEGEFRFGFKKNSFSALRSGCSEDFAQQRDVLLQFELKVFGGVGASLNLTEFGRRIGESAFTGSLLPIVVP